MRLNHQYWSKLRRHQPEILREYQHARERNVPFIVFNPLRERGHERFTDPQQPLQMITLSETKIATQYRLMKVGGIFRRSQRSARRSSR